MKKLIVLITVILFSYQITKAQTEKGSQSLGVSASFNFHRENDLITNQADNTTNQNHAKITGFSIGPDYSYFIADKLDLGASLNYSSTDYNNGAYYYLNTYHVKNYGGTVFLRKYFLYQDKLGFRAGPYVSYTNGDQKYTYSPVSGINDSDNKSTDYAGGFDLDFVYYPSKHLGLSATIANLQYDHFKVDQGAQGRQSGDNVNFYFVNNLALSVFYDFGH